jgi:chromosome segregation ATPase
MNYKLILAIIAGIAGAFIIWFFQDVPPIKTLVDWLKPQFASIIQTLKDHLTETLTAVFGSSGAIVMYLKTKYNNTAQMIQSSAAAKVDQVAAELNKTAAEKLDLTDKMNSLVGVNADLQSKLNSITGQISSSNKQLIDSQTLLSTANKRIEDLTKDNETLRKAIEFMKANPDDAYVK